MSLREVYDLNPVRLPRLHGMGFQLFVRFLENPILGRVLGAKTLSEQAIGRPLLSWR